MSVHIGEVHSDVSAAGATGSAADRPDAAPPERLEERVRRAAERAHCLRERVAAEGFDD